MPTYDYRCPEGHTFEKFYRKISEAESTLQCPVCGRPAERLVSGGAGLLFKGSGFYITDYGKDGKKDERAAKRVTKAEGASGESGSGTGSGGDKATETSGGSGATTDKGPDKSSTTTPAAPSTKPKSSRDE